MTLKFGAAANQPGYGLQQSFSDLMNGGGANPGPQGQGVGTGTGQLAVRRTYSTGAPASGGNWDATNAQGYAALGIDVIWHSFKGDINTWLSTGDGYDTELAAYVTNAKTIIDATDNNVEEVWITVWHEPENVAGMTGALYRDIQKRAFKVIADNRGAYPIKFVTGNLIVATGAFGDNGGIGAWLSVYEAGDSGKYAPPTGYSAGDMAADIFSHHIYDRFPRNNLNNRRLEWDPLPSGTGNTLGITGIFDAAVAVINGYPGGESTTRADLSFAIGELGTERDSYWSGDDGTAQLQWLQDVLNGAANDSATWEGICYFWNGTEGDWAPFPLDDIVQDWLRANGPYFTGGGPQGETIDYQIEFVVEGEAESNQIDYPIEFEVQTETGEQQIDYPVSFSIQQVTGTANTIHIGSQVLPTDDPGELMIVRGSIEITDRVAERTVASLQVVDLNDHLTIEEGFPVKIYDPNADLVFSGYVIEASYQRRFEGAVERIWDLTCVDYHYITDKRVFARAYEGLWSVEALVTDIVLTHLVDDGLTLGAFTLPPGKEMAFFENLTFQYVRVTDAFDMIADLSGWSWWVNKQGEVRWRFGPRTDYGGTPHTREIDGADMVSPPELRRWSPDYRNAQYLRGSKAQTDLQLERFLGDGEQKTFVVGFPIAQEPAIRVAGVAQTVGQRGVDTGRDWYWEEGSTELSQDQAAAAVPSLDAVEVSYYGYFDVVIYVTDEAEIQERGTREGTSGVVQATDVSSEVLKGSAGFRSAGQVLDTYSRAAVTISYRAADLRYEAGDYVWVNLQGYEEGGEFMVAEVKLFDASEDQWLYDVTLSQGPEIGSWAKRFEKAIRASRGPITIGEPGEVEAVAILEAFSEAWGWGEATTQTVAACPVPNTTLYPSTTLYPC